MTKSMKGKSQAFLAVFASVTLAGPFASAGQIAEQLMNLERVGFAGGGNLGEAWAGVAKGFDNLRLAQGGRFQMVEAGSTPGGDQVVRLGSVPLGSGVDARQTEERVRVLLPAKLREAGAKVTIDAKKIEILNRAALTQEKGEGAAVGFGAGFMIGFIAVETPALVVLQIPIVGWLVGGVLAVALFIPAVIVGLIAGLIGGGIGGIVDKAHE